LHASPRFDWSSRFDYYVPLMSLPRLCGTTINTIPGECPYLKVDPGLAAKWQSSLKGMHHPRIGIVWRGNPDHPRDRHRSVTPSLFAEFLAGSGMSVVVVQKDATQAELDLLSNCGCLRNAGPELKTYRHTAALLSALDLTISVDTSVCHLAGALGVPVWTLISFMPDWRWLTDRTDSPWYPTMRLFRQKTRGRWRALVGEIKDALRVAEALKIRRKSNDWL
jgi:hypothetical protein